MWLLRYARYCIYDTVPPCRVHVHTFTIFTVPEGPGAKIYAALEGRKNVFIVSMETVNGLENSKSA